MTHRGPSLLLRSPRALLGLVALVAVLATAGCGDDGGTAPATPEVPVPTNPCAEGFVRDPDLGACTEIVPAGECAPGTMPVIGETTCRPVGWVDACPQGFTRDASGFACLDTLASRDACAGATREDVTKGTCVPIGDCSAPFPPASATLFVDDDGPEDATHFRTLKAATLVATSGATIAIEAGTYNEIIGLDKLPDVTLVGRCAEQVRFTAGTGPKAGIYVTGKAKVSGLTVTGFRGGVLLESGDLTLEDSVLDGNNTLGAYLRFGSKLVVRRSKISNTVPGDEVGSGIVAYDESQVTLEDTAVVDNHFRNATVDKASTLLATRTVFARNTRLLGADEAHSISVEGGAKARLVQSAVLDSYHAGVQAIGEDSQLDLEQSVVRRVTGKLKTSGGVGAQAYHKGRVTLTSSAVTDAPVLGVYAGVGGGVMKLDRSAILGLPKGTAGLEFGRCASASEGGRLEMTDVAVVACPQSGIGLQYKATGDFFHVLVKDAFPLPEAAGEYGGFGLLVENESKATVKSSALLGNTLAAMASNFGSEVTAEAVLVRGTRPLGTLTPGTAAQVAKDSVMNVTRSAFVGNATESAVVASGGRLVMTSSTLHGTTPAQDGEFGHGIAVFSTASALLDDVAVYDSAAVGLVCDGGQAQVRGGVFARNAVAVHAQNGTTITQSAAEGEVGETELRVSPATRFVGNGARTGTGLVALPPAPIE